MENFSQVIADAGLAEDVILTGYINDTELNWLYSNCFAFIYPSLYEGFGLPVLEAMHLGAPVITSNRAPLTEITGNSALLVDPDDTDSLYQAMLELLSNHTLCQNLNEAGPQRASLFTWNRARKKMLHLYEYMKNTQQAPKSLAL